MFQVFNLAHYVESRPEPLGTKEKMWMTPRIGVALQSRPHLFKIGRPNTGENWSEKASSELARFVNLPAAHYELAEFDGRKGVITETFIPDTGTLVLGNVILSNALRSYDTTKTFNHCDYKLTDVLRIIERFRLEPPISINRCAYGMSGIDYFVGYLLFDCLIGNTDRHHENWGAIFNDMGEKDDFHLSPSFDHASCLGRNELEAKRSLRLSTRDQRASVEAYAAKAKSAFYGAVANTGTLKLADVLAELVATHPRATRVRSERIGALTDADFHDTFANFPADWITQSAADFAIRMLRHNRQMIREVGCA